MPIYLYQHIEKIKSSVLFKPCLVLLMSAYKIIITLRFFFYKIGIFKTKKLPCKVICIGNLTLGGTGKTSLVVELTKELKNKKICIINKGYKRKIKKKIINVEKNERLLPEDIGDEPYLLSTLTECPVTVASNRYLAGLISIKKYQPQVILLDDGLQHLKLHKDISILCIDALNPLWNEKLFPLGNLRQEVTLLNIPNIHLIALMKYNLISDDMQTLWMNYLSYRFNKKKIVRFLTVPLYFVSCYNDEIFPLESMKNKEVILISTIGNPRAFYILIRSLKINIISHIAYIDHYSYRPIDIYRLQNYESPIITTEKDGLKLRKYKTDLPELFKRIFYVKTRVAPLDEKSWHDFIAEL